MRRSGFTMIELIFVIVILGILASVAIPKLAATRDDAKLVSAATAVGVAISEITAYYTAKGEFNQSVPTVMSNALAESIWTLNIPANPNPSTVITADYSVNDNDCIRLSIGSGDVNVSRISANTDAICDSVSARVPDRNITIGGTGVVY